MSAAITQAEIREAERLAERLTESTARNVYDAAQHYLNTGQESAAVVLYHTAVTAMASTMAAHMGAPKAVLALRRCADAFEALHRRNQH